MAEFNSSHPMEVKNTFIQLSLPKDLDETPEPLVRNQTEPPVASVSLLAEVDPVTISPGASAPPNAAFISPDGIDLPEGLSAHEAHASSEDSRPTIDIHSYPLKAELSQTMIVKNTFIDLEVEGETPEPLSRIRTAPPAPMATSDMLAAEEAMVGEKETLKNPQEPSGDGFESACEEESGEEDTNITSFQSSFGPCYEHPDAKNHPQPKLDPQYVPMYVGDLASDYPRVNPLTDTSITTQNVGHAADLEMKAALLRMQAEQVELQARSIRNQSVMPAVMPTDMPPAMTTIMLRNIPNNITRTELVEILTETGALPFIDFLYLPHDLNRRSNLGYAFINLVSCEAVEWFWNFFTGFNDWKGYKSKKEAEVAWSQMHGFYQHVERYKNSPIMHHSVDDDYKPMIFQKGVVVPFPEPTKRIRPPKSSGK